MRTKSTVELRMAGESGGCGVRVGALRAPRSGPVWERRGARGGKGTFQGRTAASEGGRHEQSLTILRSVPIASFLPSRVVARFRRRGTVACRVCRAVLCRASPFRSVPCRAVQVPFLSSFLRFFMLCETRCDASRLSESN